MRSGWVFRSSTLPGKAGISRVGSRGRVFIDSVAVTWQAPFPLLFHLESMPLPWLMEPFWNVPGRESRLSSQLGNNNVFTFSWPFLRWGPFIYVSLSIEINWLMSRNCVSLQTFRNKKLLFWCIPGAHCPRFLYLPGTQGWRRCFIVTCYWILRNDQVSRLSQGCAFPGVTPRRAPSAFSEHGALAGTPSSVFPAPGALGPHGVVLAGPEEHCPSACPLSSSHLLVCFGTPPRIFIRLFTGTIRNGFCFQNG